MKQHIKTAKTEVRLKCTGVECVHLDVPLEVKEVDPLPVAAVQGQNIPGLRAREGDIQGQDFFSPPSNTHHKHTCKLTQHRLTLETWAQRQSVTTSRKEKILEDRQGWFLRAP